MNSRINPSVGFLAALKLIPKQRKIGTIAIIQYAVELMPRAFEANRLVVKNAGTAEIKTAKMIKLDVLVNSLLTVEIS